MKLLFVFLFITPAAFAFDFGELKESDQKYFKNEFGEGNNKRERIDKNVKEINKMWSEINDLKAQVKVLQEEITQLKGQRK